MNTLRDKIIEAINRNVDHDPDLGIFGQHAATAEIQSIAEDFAVKFAEWKDRNYTRSIKHSGHWVCIDTCVRHTIQEMVTEFQKVYSPNIKEGEKG